MWFWMFACIVPPDDESPEKTGEVDVATEVREGGEILCESPEQRDGHPMDLVTDWKPLDASPLNQPLQYGGGGATVADLDGDDRLDILLPNAGQDQLWMQGEDGLFVDETTSRWPLINDGTVGAVPLDIDLDGDLDLFATEMHNGNRLMINDGSGHFLDQSTDFGLTGGMFDNVSASFADMDGDGDLDLFVARHKEGGEGDNGMQSGTMVEGHPSGLYQNNGGNSFTDVSDRLPAQLQYNGYPFAGGWIDLNGDALPELYIVNDFGPMSLPNPLLQNTGSGFVDLPESGLSVSSYSMGLAIGDVNADGRPDMAISDWGRIYLMIDDGTGHYYDAAEATGVTPSPDQAESWGIQFADMDNDGDLDLPVAFGALLMDAHAEQVFEDEYGLPNPKNQPDSLFLQQDGGLFVDDAADWDLDQTGVTRGFALADINRDGWLDVVKRYEDRPASLNLSRCGREGWLEISLEQAGPNPAAVGAQITVWAAGERWTRWIVAGGTGFSSGQPLEAHFGLGDLDSVESIEVRWPDGQHSTVAGVSTRQRIWITRKNEP